MVSDPAERPTGEDYRLRAADMGAEKWLDVDGIRTRYFDQGEGQPVVFIHGGNIGSIDGVTARSWDLNFGPLARHCNVIAPERLGQGYTDLPKRDSDYSMDASVDHVARFLTLLGKGPYHLIGHSRGGFVVTCLTMKYPHLVKTCHCISSGTLSPFIGRNHIVHAALPTSGRRDAVRAIYELYCHNPRLISDAMVDEGTRVVASEKFRTGYRKMYEEGLDREVFTPQLGKQRREIYGFLLGKGMPCPTLLSWGYRDPTAVFDNGKQLVEMFMKHQPDTRLHVFNRAGHFVFRDYAEQFNRLQHAFISAYN